MPHLDFCKMVAETITSKHNQHVTLMIYAPTGKGKSWAAMAIGERVAQYVAAILKGREEDYFSVDNIAIITQQEIIRLLKTKLGVRYSVIGFDDIGVGWNSRDFMSEFNKTMNDIYQTFRTRNCFLYVTLPDPRLIDVVPRDMVKFIMEVVHSHHDDGYVECKIFEVTKNMRIQKKIYPYLQDLEGNKIIRHLIYAPSLKYTEPYEFRRAEIEKINSNNAISNLENLLTKSDAKEKIVSPNFKLVEAAVRLVKEHKYTIKEACHIVNVPPSTYQDIKTKNKLGESIN